MKVRNKITITIIILGAFIVIFSNILFVKFFSNYLEHQENDQVNSISRSVGSFIFEKSQKYQGNINDWSNWDETYDFINSGNQEYIDRNLNEDTFTNLDLNFIIIAKEDNSIKIKQFYDMENKKFIDIPTNYDKAIEDILKSTPTTSTSSRILKMGNEYYFLATSLVTDSLKEKAPNGKMIIGRVIDKSMITNLEEITGSHISFFTISNVSKDVTREPIDNSMLNILKLSKEKDVMQMEFIIPDTNINGSTNVIKLAKTRDLFLGGMNQIKNFLIIYTISMCLILLLIFVLLGAFISRPFTKLIEEIKGLNLAENETKKLMAHGKDEFSFLRRSVNIMLSKIEMEQYKVRENKEKLYATLSSVGDGVIAVDRDGMVDFINPIAEILTGWSQEEAYKKPFEEIFDIIMEYDRGKIESPVQKVFETEETIELANHTVLISKDKIERAIEDTASPIKDKHGKVIGVVLVFRDVSEKNQKQREIQYLSYHDQLTGLYNRRFFEEELIRIDSKINLPLSFVFADINGLKTFNDAFGHKYGDQLIIQVAEVLKTECGPSDIISRTGGDEFILLLPKTEEDAVMQLVGRIKEKLKQKKIMDISISVSFGWDTKTIDDQSSAILLKNAEDIMYKKKILNISSKRSAVIRSILNTLQLKSPREDAHSKRVSILCKQMGNAYNLTDYEIKELGIAGELHDIGKIAVDEVILNKPGKLSPAEWEQIKKHPETGYRLLGTSSEYYNIAEYVLSHHEKWDGTGYPKGLKGEEINWKARMITIADSYDAMTCLRPYREGLTQEQAIIEIKKNAGIQFDPDIARVFVEKVLKAKW